ncbi:MAG TPA: 23S rRNA (guanine(745)-N(1))-methyltransferase [Rheinheimera sp.]|uniref:23S rRNA (guanine(745)-N(1))-methyltransferase n=1 Tax=Rheinheimera sp. TaxID=1869214 RepID=UPI000EE3C5E9|nr:23S rRNA (guanine(745)-N(1))-methyltransferase [Rheinheimera sp.]HCU65152.1 23S rRNA (guanine(745)-N(1))-methyltransferase [Rheinheimera sp.]
MYRCPLCQQPLLANDAGLQCQNRHQFDRAREGYFHLLPVQQKKSLTPGDSAEMIQARRAFLEAGFYQPLSDAVNQLFTEALAARTVDDRSAPVLLDIGCGEGYYSNRLAQALPQLTLYGIDISKAAVRAASKKYPKLHCAVASSYQLPFADSSFEMLLRIYAPSEPTELARVAAPGAWLLTVTPAPEHLLQLKQQIYSQVRLHPQAVQQQQGFHHHKRQQLSWLFQPKTPVELEQLLQMIPLGYKVNAELNAQLCRDLPAIKLDFYLDLYQRDSSA